MQPIVQVLLSTYNGEKYLKEQIDSLIGQNDVTVRIFIRDDGSTDNTLDILEQYRERIDMKIIKGEKIGFAQSFWSLIKECDEEEYYAFCDQDDVWDSHKLIAAVSMISSLEKDEPILYTGNVIKVDANLNILEKKGFHANGVLSFANSLKKTILPGCTFVFNKKLCQQLKKFNGDMIAHDWTTYSIAAATGTVIYDDIPYIRYRIHGNNTIGIDSIFTEYSKKIKRFIKPWFPNARSIMAMRIYELYSDNMTSDKKEICFAFGNYRTSYKYIKKLWMYPEYKDFVFRILLLLKKV